MTGPGPVQSHPQTPPRLPSDAGNASTLDPAKEAAALLEVGSRWGRDDYDARAIAFGEAMQQGDAAYRQELVAEILKQDPNAFNSWMTPTRINDLVDSGRISPNERGAMAEAIAGAFNNGQIPGHEMRNQFGEVTGTASALDTYAYSGTSGSFDLDAQVEHAHNMREFAEFFSGPLYSAEVSAFRENYANHLITNYALNDKVDNGMLRDNAATMAAIVLNGDPTRGDIAADVLSGLDQGQLDAFMERVARGGQWLTAEQLQHAVDGSVVAMRDGLSVSDIALADQASSLIAQVARVDSPEAQEAAAMLARLPANEADIFSDRHSMNSQDRIDAMGLLFSNHSTAILDSLTDFDTTRIGSKDDSDLKQYMQDASDLGALFNIVLFNADQTYQGSARAAVLDYATALKERINTEEGDAEAMGQLAMLMGGADDAITQGFDSLKAREEAQEKLLSFIVDLAVAGIPLAGRAKDSIAELLGEVFESKAVTDALKGLSGKIIDAATGQLTKEAKEALAEVVGADEAELMSQQGASNALREAMLSGIDNQRDLAAVENYAEDVSQGINIWRK